MTAKDSLILALGPANYQPLFWGPLEVVGAATGPVGSDRSRP